MSDDRKEQKRKKNGRHSFFFSPRSIDRFEELWPKKNRRDEEEEVEEILFKSKSEEEKKRNTKRIDTRRSISGRIQ